MKFLISLSILGSLSRREVRMEENRRTGKKDYKVTKNKRYGHMVGKKRGNCKQNEIILL